MKNRPYKILLLSGSLLIFLMEVTISCNNLQTPGAMLKADSLKTDSASKGKDAQFMVTVAKINLEEIKLGQLAEQKGNATDVKELGKMMEEDHTKAQSDLIALALKESITLPNALDTNGWNDYNNLNNLSGIDFDKQYCNMMQSGHQGAITLFEKEAADAGDSAICRMAAATLPTLKKHLEHVTMCQQNGNRINN